MLRFVEIRDLAIVCPRDQKGMHEEEDSLQNPPFKKLKLQEREIVYEKEIENYKIILNCKEKEIENYKIDM